MAHDFVYQFFYGMYVLHGCMEYLERIYIQWSYENVKYPVKQRQQTGVIHGVSIRGGQHPRPHAGAITYGVDAR